MQQHFLPYIDVLKLSPNTIQSVCIEFDFLPLGQRRKL